MERNYNRKSVYRLFYMDKHEQEQEMYFTSKEEAQLMERMLKIQGYKYIALNVWKWEMLIEK